MLLSLLHDKKCCVAAHAAHVKLNENRMQPVAGESSPTIICVRIKSDSLISLSIERFVPNYDIICDYFYSNNNNILDDTNEHNLVVFILFGLCNSH